MNEITNAERLYKIAKDLLTIAQATYNRSTEEEAVELLKQSAAENYALAWIELARCYDKGTGVEEDENEALNCYKKAADLGDEKAAFEYARRQHYDYYDDEEAIAYLDKLIDTETDGNAKYLLGLIYYHGHSIEEDYDKSFEFHMQSAKQGNANALFELYVYYSQGIGCETDSAVAFEWLKKAADAGHFRACYNMGWYYETGPNVEKDIDLAFSYYTTASENGNGKATAYLGVMYQKGMVRPDTVLDENGNWSEDKAIEIAEGYYGKSSEQGFYELDEFLDSLGI